MMYGLYDNYGGWGPGNMMGWFGGGLMMIVFWVLLVVFIVWIVREIGGKSSRSSGNSNALDILNERYAKGEIDKKEFEEKKKDLSN
ncbi:MAG: SHOCT domain-containing protein [Patescibacteria group bacterium]